MSSSYVSPRGSLFGFLLSSNGCRSGAPQQPTQSFHLKTRASVKDEARRIQIAPLQANQRQQLEDRVREQLVAAEPTPSSYDTAWVAMVPAPGCPQAPRFPRCLEWILQNQHGDGSWGLGRLHPPLAMDALSSTLACVLALRKWGVGDEHVGKGLCFIGGQTSCITDGSCEAPVGFNIIFSGMLRLGIDMGLEIPLTQDRVNGLLRLRDMELRRGNAHNSMASGRKAFMAYVAEGLGDLQDWDQVVPFQRKNGSFFNSPSTTAAAAIHNYNDSAIDYLDSLVAKFGGSVPTAYPLNVYSGLCIVDRLEKMGIAQSFAYEINNILDMAYRSWLRKDEEIVLDMATSAMAFRLLRMHGYDVSSDGLAQFTEESSFHDSVQGFLNDTNTLIELYKASQVQILEDELVLEKIGSWSRKLLKHQLLSNNVSRSVDPAEV